MSECVGARAGHESRKAKIADQCLPTGCLKNYYYYFGISKATQWLFPTFSLVITTGDSWEPSSGSYDAESYSLLAGVRIRIRMILPPWIRIQIRNFYADPEPGT